MLAVIVGAGALLALARMDASLRVEPAVARACNVLDVGLLEMRGGGTTGRGEAGRVVEDAAAAGACVNIGAGTADIVVGVDGTDCVRVDVVGAAGSLHHVSSADQGTCQQ